MSHKNGKMDPNSVLVQFGAETLRNYAEESMKQFSTSPDAGAYGGSKIEPSPSQLPDSDFVIRGDRITFTFSERVYEVDGLSKNRAPGSLSVTIHAKSGESLFADKIELYGGKRTRALYTRVCRCS